MAKLIATEVINCTDTHLYVFALGQYRWVQRCDCTLLVGGLVSIPKYVL